MKYSPKEVKKSLDQNSFSFKKKFGQNFIIDENIIDSIIKKSAIDKNTLVIEIGPGAGSLTYKLASIAGQVLAYEIDVDLKDILSSNLKEFNNVDIIYEDFLKKDVSSDIKKYNYKKIYVVANLPYYITTPIITKIIEEKLPVEKIVVMVQKEVGDRFKAIPGTKDYGSLSVYLGYYFKIKKLMDVSRNVFIPKPNVDSIVVSLERRHDIYKLENADLFFNLVRDSFKQKRKTIRNNLKRYDLNVIENVLKKYNYDLTVRAEQLSIEIFVSIANELSKL